MYAMLQVLALTVHFQEHLYQQWGNLTLECKICDQQTNTCLSSWNEIFDYIFFHERLVRSTVRDEVTPSLAGKIRWGILIANKKTILEFSDEPLLLFILQSQKLHHLLVEDQVVGDQWSGRQGLIYGELAITLWIILHPSSYPAGWLDKKCNNRPELLLWPHFQNFFFATSFFHIF